MSDWNAGRFIRAGIAFVISAYSGNWAIFASQVMREDAAVKASKQRKRAVQQYNDSVQNRLEMLDLEPDSPRTLVLGRVRAVEGVRDRWTSGTHDEVLTMVVSFAGHQIDAFEQWYLDDKPVTLDVNGWVQEAPWNTVVDTAVTAEGTTDGSGNATITLAGAPTVGTPVWATVTTGSGSNVSQSPATVSVSGTTATVTGGVPLSAVTVFYRTGVGKRTVRIRPFLGAPGQNVSGALSSDYPGKLGANDRFAGFALAVVDVYYDPDIFPQGRPNVTAVMRGALCLDPRTNTTAWTENPALHAYHYARWANGWALDIADVRTADISAAADVCDVSTVFTLRKPDTSTTTVTLPRFRTGTVISSDADPGQAMDELVQSMAGRHGWAGGLWRVRAGALASTVATITSDWLVQPTRAGRASDEPVITAVQSVARDQRFNRVIGKCVDPSQRYQMLPFPAVQDATLIAAKGLRQVEVNLQAVTHIAHAQHLASIIIRQAQAGLRLQLVVDDRAADLELFDVVALDMAKYGYSGKTFEVVGTEYSQTGPYKLTLAEITSAIYAPASELVGRDPAPDSDLRLPWEVEQLTGLAVASGVTAQTDGSIITRAVVTWSAAVGESIRRGGQVEVQYTEATGTLPTGDWPSWVEAGTAIKAVIPGLLSGRYYVFRVRAVQPLPLVRGPWSTPALHQIATRPLVDTAGLAPNAATEIYSNTPSSSVTVTQVKTTPDAYARNTELATLTFTPTGSGEVNVYAEGRGFYINTSGSLASAQYSIQQVGATYNGWNELEATVAGSSTETFAMTTSRRFTVTAGVSYTFGFVAAKLGSGDTFVVDSIQMRAEVIKR